jgi:radical SAM protein with 4Fe4S-binding SPASM domain
MQKIKFRFKGNHVDSFAELGNLRAVFLDLTNRCNLSCRYCFNHRALQAPPSHLGIDLIEKALRSKLAASVKDWFFSGGEPLLYDHLPGALRLFRDHGIGPKIATNGINVTSDIIDAWVRSGVRSVQFSLDTLTPYRHAYLSNGGRQDVEAVLQHLEQAINSSLRVVVSSVLTEVNKSEIRDIMAFCIASGVDSYTLYPDVPSEPLNKELIVAFPELLELADDLFSVYSSLCPTKIIDITIPCFSDSPAYAKWKDILVIRLHYCAAAQYALKITSDGRVSACICQASAPFIIGDLRRDSLDDIWVSEKAREFRSLYKQIPECAACSKNELCRGGCRNNASLFGTRGLHSLDPYCQFLGSRMSRKKSRPGDEEETFPVL